MEYNDENLLALYAQGLSYREIAVRLGASHGKVAGRLRRIKLKNPSLVFDRPKPVKKEKEPTPIKVKQTNKYTIAIKPRNYLSPSKADLREMLKKAVENT